jgi:hypothetical protein
LQPSAQAVLLPDCGGSINPFVTDFKPRTLRDRKGGVLGKRGIYVAQFTTIVRVSSVGMRDSPGVSTQPAQTGPLRFLGVLFRGSFGHDPVPRVVLSAQLARFRRAWYDGCQLHFIPLRTLSQCV